MFDQEKIANDVVLQVWSQYFWLAQALFLVGTQDDITQVLVGPLVQEIKLLCGVANGDYDRASTDPMIVGEIGETIQHVAEVLFTAPAGSYSYTIPDQFWTEPLGQVIAHCQIWLRGDDLITHSTAAEALYQDASEKSLNKLRRLIDNGKLKSYTDPREPNPQKAGRVSRQAVEGLRDV